MDTGKEGPEQAQDCTAGKLSVLTGPFRAFWFCSNLLYFILFYPILLCSVHEAKLGLGLNRTPAANSLYARPVTGVMEPSDR